MVSDKIKDYCILETLLEAQNKKMTHSKNVLDFLWDDKGVNFLEKNFIFFLIEKF